MEITTTWRELIEMIRNDEIELVNIQKKFYIGKLKSLKRKILDEPIKNSSMRDIGQLLWFSNDDLIVVPDDTGKLLAIIREHEIVNPFVFEDAIIVCCSETVTCYNKTTKKSIRK